MPLPKPRQDEEKQDFISRCMSNDTMQEEYPDQSQRSGVCHTQWDEAQQNQQKEATISSLHHNLSELVEHREMDGDDYLVAPTVMIVEGVLNNVYYPAEEIAICPAHWNGRPVVVEHSIDENGNPKTANDPDERERRTVGWIYNTQYVEENGQAKLKAEAWISPNKCRQVPQGNDVLLKLENNEPIEVSTGVFTFDRKAPGQYKGNRYDYQASELRGDHLALLPNGTGACSWDDGAGIPRINQQQTEDKHNMKNGEDKKKDKLNRLVDNIKQKFRSNETGISDLYNGLMSILEEKYENRDVGRWVFIEDIFPSSNSVVFEISSNDGTAYYKQPYEENENGEFVLQDDAQEVAVRTEYVPKNQEQQNLEQETKTNNKESNMDRDKVINFLLENSDYSEDDKDSLNELSDDMLTKMKSTVEKTLEDNSGEEGEEGEQKNNKETSGESEEDENKESAVHYNSEEEYIASLPEGELKQNMLEAVKERRQEHNNLVENLKKNDRCEFEEDELKQMNLSQLRKVAKLAKVSSYEGKAGGPAPATNTSKTAPQMPSINWEEGKIETSNDNE